MDFRYIDYRTEKQIPKDKNYLSLYLAEKAAINRINLVSAIAEAGSGHPGGSLSCADIITTLFDYADLGKTGKDGFVLSAGHKAPILYAQLAADGFIPTEKLRKLRKIHGLQGHPEAMPGIQVPTGSLGQGLSLGNGIAIGLRQKGSDKKVYVLMGDGELDEGQVWEAAMFASHYKLNNITALVDHNGLQIDGRNDDVMKVRPIRKKFEAFGWAVVGEDMPFDERQADGHDYGKILQYFDKALFLSRKGMPVACIFNTIKGKGVSFMENNYQWHGKAPKEDEYYKALIHLDEKLRLVRTDYEIRKR